MARITKNALENELMSLLKNPTYTDNDGEEQRMTAMEIQAKVAIIKQLCNMRGYNSPEEKIVHNKEYTLNFK